MPVAPLSPVVYGLWSVTRRPSGGLQISNIRGPPGTGYDNLISKMKFVQRVSNDLHVANPNTNPINDTHDA